MNTYLNANQLAQMARPADVEAERRLISAVLACPPELLAMVMGRLRPDLFTILTLVDLAQAIKEDWDRGLPPDFGLLSQRMTDVKKSSVVAELRGTTDGSQVLNYLSRCESQAAARELQASAFEVVRKLAANQEDPAAVIADFNHKAMTCATPTSNFVDAGAALQARYTELMDSMQDDRFRPVTTGIAALDTTCGGMLDDCVIVGAANSVGKTAMLNTIANANIDSLRPDEFIYFASAEMTTNELIDRTVSARLKINSALFRSPSYITKRQWTDIFAQQQALASRLAITYDTEILPEHIFSRLYAEKAKGRNCRVVLVDYLQLLGVTRLGLKKSGGFGAKETELRHAVGEVLKDLKAIAKEFKIPVVIAAQVNRDPERLRPDRPVPAISNIAESANAEQKTDVAWLLYRHHRFHPQSACHTHAEIHIAKMRSGGSVGVIQANYQGEYTTFSDRVGMCVCFYCQQQQMKGGKK